MNRVELIFYSHAGCCLCDRLEELIAPHLDSLRKRGEVDLIKRDIADDPVWHDRYHERIPVLTLGERVILEGRPEEEEVQQAFAAIQVSLLAGNPRVLE
jgi:hypothetical protein